MPTASRTPGWDARLFDSTTEKKWPRAAPTAGAVADTRWGADMGKRRPFRPTDGIDRHIVNVVDGGNPDDRWRLDPDERRRAQRMDRPTTVYYMHDANHTLLYVGVSSSKLGIARFQQHKSDKDWWSDVAYISLEHFSTRDEALDREAHAIYHLGPRYNQSIPTPVRRNEYGVRLCACGCRAPAGEHGRHNPTCTKRRSRTQ